MEIPGFDKENLAKQKELLRNEITKLTILENLYNDLHHFYQNPNRTTHEQFQDAFRYIKGTVGSLDPDIIGNSTYRQLLKSYDEVKSSTELPFLANEVYLTSMELNKKLKALG